MLRQAETRLKSELPDREERKEAAIFHIKKRLGHKRELYRIPLPRKEPSTCASGNQTEKGYVGVFIKNNTPNRVRFMNRSL